MPDPSSPRRRRSRGTLLAFFIAVVLVYVGSPYYSVWRFGEALRARDLNALSARVDFEAVRGSLKRQIRNQILGVAKKKKNDLVAQLLTANAGDPLDQLIDAYITPEGLAEIISDPSAVRNARSISSLPGIGGPPREVAWSKFGGAFFTGLRDFAVEHEGIKLRFRFNGVGWKLHDLDLQLPAVEVKSDE